ncbi:abortive infection protein [Methanolobus psychrophilus R15]|nr:abortive infection protein [Methanolobus psychrophilus R15]
MELRRRHISKNSLSYYLTSKKDPQILLIPVIAIISAEMLIYSGHVSAGVILHVITMLSLSVIVMWTPESHISRSFQVLALLPLLRLLNVSMPVYSEMTLYFFIFIYVPLLLPAYLVIRHQGMDLQSIGLTSRKLLIYIPLSFIVGGIIGWGESMIIPAANLVPDLSVASLLKLSIVMIFIVGFIEELIFRSLLQTRMESSFGMFRGLLIASLLFGVMHSGYGTFQEILYTFCAGMVLGYMFQRTGSLPLVSLTHGFVNIFLFGFIPLLPYF